MDPQLLMIKNLNEVLSGLNLDARCVAAKQNRHMAFYDVSLNPGCKVRKIESSAPEIALALRSCTEPFVKILSDKGIVRLHVAIREADILHLDSIYSLDDLNNSSLLPFLLGETAEGHKLWTDMTKNPHMLVAGGTGSGKSVFLHLLIENIYRLNNCGKYDVSLWLSDPKRVEFNKYSKSVNDVRNIESIAESYEETILLLQRIEEIMENTYTLLRELGFSSVEQLPKSFKKHFVIIDEVADLMLYDRKSKRFENLIARLAQKARAAGIYLVLATQRPSVDVLTGVIKANFQARVSCKVSSKVDSRVILDRSGSENLLGRGDAIIKNHDNDYVRFQVALS